MKYTVVSGTMLTFTEQVNEMISQGWTPQGGVMLHGGGLAQAMVRNLVTVEESEEDDW